jgi:transposase
MAQKLDQEARMTLRHLNGKGHSKSAIARLLGVTEGSIRYHLKRQAEGAVDGRSHQPFLADEHAERIAHWLESLGEAGPVNLAALHDYLVEEHEYAGSLRSLQRYFRARFPRPARRARRRVETPPGAQAQADWAEYPRLRIAGEEVKGNAFTLTLSHSRKDAVVWSPRKDQLSWHHVHNEAFRRLDGIPATVRVDNEKTAVSRVAGAWGEINPSYRRYALAVRFHVDACPPRSPWMKGKVERRIRDRRLDREICRRDWESWDELQAHTDEQTERSARRRTCPATGTRVAEAWEAEKRHLAPIPILPEPFDLVVNRRAGIDCMIAFEGRSYSVPFSLVGHRVEVRGCARDVQILARGTIVASHPRRTRERIVIDPAHFEGEATPEVIPPPPLGRLARRLQEIAAMEPEKRPLDLYVALAEVAR